MTNKEVQIGIENLRFTEAMILFDPQTGEDKMYENLNGDDKATVDGCRAGIEALEKQIAKKPLWEIIAGHNASYCSNCKDCYVGGNYCHNCGQKIDWGEELNND